MKIQQTFQLATVATDIKKKYGNNKEAYIQNNNEEKQVLTLQKPAACSVQA